jgi:hypothetical protein
MPAIVAILLSLTGAAPALNAVDVDFKPFGVSQRERPSSLGCRPITGAPMDATGQYVCDRLPAGTASFEQYIIAYVQGVGICNLVGVSPFGRDDDRGTGVRKLFLQAKAQLIPILGNPDEDVDQLASSNENFRSAIVSEDGQVFLQWNSLASRYANVDSATLAIAGDEELGLAIYQVYRFAGNDACLDRMELVTGLSGDE